MKNLVPFKLEIILIKKNKKYRNLIYLKYISLKKITF